MLFRYGDWHASEQHWTNVGRQLRIEHRHVEDSDVAAIRDTLPFGPPNPMHVLDLSPELGAAPDFDFPSLGRGNVQAAPSLSRMASHGAEPQGQSSIGTEGALRGSEAQEGGRRGPGLEVQILPAGHIRKGASAWITSSQSPEGERARPTTCNCSAAAATSARATGPQRTP